MSLTMFFLITLHEYALQHIWALITNNSYISITELANSNCNHYVWFSVSLNCI